VAVPGVSDADKTAVYYIDSVADSDSDSNLDTVAADTAVDVDTSVDTFYFGIADYEN